jgi:hypothetical protein
MRLSVSLFCLPGGSGVGLCRHSLTVYVLCDLRLFSRRVASISESSTIDFILSAKAT